MAVLNFNKVVRKGVLKVDFYQEQEGTVGLLFKFESPDHFTVLELTPTHA